MVYTPVSDIILFFSQSQKNCLSLKDINTPLLHAKFQKDWFETVENMSPLKYIFDSGVQRVKTLGQYLSECSFKYQYFVLI